MVGIFRTDLGADGIIDPQAQGLPDILEMTIGTFQPTDPQTSRFDGQWDLAGGYMRFDLVVAGLANPPGPLAFDDTLPVYDPFLYGANPIFGFIEFDLDADENTGGELSDPEDRYLGNVARWGGHPTDPRFVGRVALDGSAFDGSVQSPPLVDRSGEEFHIAFLGEDIDQITVNVENGVPGVFEPGEVWDVEGTLWHRAHGFEKFAFRCVTRPGKYKPDVVLRFAHDTTSDRTTISMVYPLTNAADAALSGSATESNDGCARTQNSIEEALDDLQFSAANADPFDMGLPEFQLIAGWATQTPSAFLDATAWRIALCVGTAYGVQQPDGSRYAWTDVYPNLVSGDFDGNGVSNDGDKDQLNLFVAQNDGDPLVDGDGIGNNDSITLILFGTNFSIYDTNYDGIVDHADAVILGDLNLDQDVDFEDVDDFVQALLDPAAYALTHVNANPVPRGDFTGDGVLDGADIQGMLDAVLAPPSQSPMGDFDMNQATNIEDVDDFVLALVDPVSFANQYPTADPIQLGDFSGDGLFNGDDIAGMVQAVLAGP
ncbi:MAG: hypothetical protein ACE5E1_06805 [Phycisphaerae bacterium]